MAVKKVNTSGVTSGKYGDYEYGSLTSYDPKYETQINDNLSKIENYGDYQSQYQPQINDALSRVTDKTPYTSRYQAQIDDYVNKLSGAYDPNADASYLAYKNQYMRGGQKAMQDTMAKAVALSGGFDNSYANSVAQQTYNDYMTGLADKIPELAKAANDMYQSRLGMFQNLDATDYGRWADERANNYNMLNALQGLDNTAYGRWNDSRTNLYNLLNAYNNQENQNYSRFRDEYSMWGNAWEQQNALEQAAAAAAAAAARGSGGRGGRGSGSSQTPDPSYFSTYNMDYYGGQSEGASYMSNENRQNYQQLLQNQGYTENEAKKISKDYQRLYNRS